MKSRVLKCACHYVINHTCQPRSPRSRKLLLSAVGRSSLVAGFLWFLHDFWSLVCVSLLLGQFSSYPRRPQVSQLQSLMWELIRGEESPNMLTTCWLRSHTQSPLWYFTGQKKGTHTSSWQRQNGERHPSVISTHTHTVRDLWYKALMAPSHTFLSVFLSPLSTQTHIRPSPSSSFLFSLLHLFDICCPSHRTSNFSSSFSLSSSLSSTLRQLTVSLLSLG